MILRRTSRVALTEPRTCLLEQIGGSSFSVFCLQAHCYALEVPSNQESPASRTLQKYSSGFQLHEKPKFGLDDAPHYRIAQKGTSDYHILISAREFRAQNALALAEGFGDQVERESSYKPSEQAVESSEIPSETPLAPVSNCICQTPSVPSEGSSQIETSSCSCQSLVECGIGVLTARECPCTNQMVKEHPGIEWKDSYFPDYPSLLRSCGQDKTLCLGKEVHHALCCNQMETDTYIGVVLVEMYLRCEAIEDAHSIFFSLHVRSTFSWNLIIRSYTGQRHDAEALLCLHQILAEASLADKFTYVSLLSSCVKLADLGETRRIHTCILSGLHQSDIIVRNALINAYTKSGSINEARIIFDMMSERDSFSWDTLIGAYAQHKVHYEALFLYYQQQHQGVLPTRITYVSILDSCSSQGITGETTQILSRIFGSEFKGNAIVQAAILHFFGRVGSKERAWRMFSEMSERDSFAWNVILASCPGCKSTLELYSRMLAEGMLPGEETFVRVISLCTDPTTISLGKYMHACSISSPINFRFAIGNALISMYGRCAGLKDACRVFDSIPERNIVTWTSIVGAYVAHGQAMFAIKLFDQTLGEGLLSDKIMLISILNACTSLRSPARIKRLHARIMGMGLDSDVEVGSCLVSLYGKCGALKAAERMFDSISDRNTLLWTAMVCAYTEHNRPFYALQMFQQMKQEAILPNEVTFFGALEACAKLFALGEGRRFHAHLASSVFDEMFIKTALIKMYGRCGSLEESQRVFDDATEHDIVLFTAMMANYTKSGKVKQALHLFDKALQRGVKPDEIAYINVLSMCSHAGLLEEGRRYFFSMRQYHNVKPTVDHYSCMIVLYGRAGCVREAEDMITNMPFRATALQWMTLLSACRRQLDVERGERAARQVMLLEPKDPTPHVELFNIYSVLRREAEAAALLSKLKHLNDKNAALLMQ